MAKIWKEESPKNTRHFFALLLATGDPSGFFQLGSEQSVHEVILFHQLILTRLL